MNKKILALFLFLFVLFSTSIAFGFPSTFTPIKPKDLPYAYDALEPYIDKETMDIHYNKHYKTYIKNLNNTLKNYPELYEYSVSELLTNLDSLPKDSITSIKNNGGGVYNHELFFDIMTPDTTTPSGSLKEAIDDEFGSFNEFKDEFKDASLSVFGSGWAWLVSDAENNLSIITTANQDSPITLGLNPIIGIDVWEHAYYLKYKNARNKYIDNWFNVIDWDKALINYENSENQ